MWLNRPDKLNAINPAGWADLPPIMGAVGSDEDIRVVVIAGRGRAFTAGIDLFDMAPELAGSHDDPATVAGRRAFRGRIEELQRTFTSLATCPKPVIAAIHGSCIGAGVDLITACDVRLASENAVFSIRETRLAMVADLGTLQRLPRIITPGRVGELVYTGRDFDAAEALELGLVSSVHRDRSELLAAAYELAHAIAANSPLAVQGAKAVLAANDGRTVEEALDHVALWNAAFFHSNDVIEAMQAFTERRRPEFEGD